MSIGEDETNPGFPLPRRELVERAQATQERMRVVDTVMAWIKDGNPRTRCVSFETESDGQIAVVVTDAVIGSSARLRLDVAGTDDPIVAASIAMMRVGM
jgi:hypothetical protein